MPFDLASLLSAGGGGAAVAFGFYKFFGTKWLESKFQASIEKLRHQQRQELETFKISTNSSLDRLNKLNQREYEVLPKAWELLVLLQLHVSRFVASYKESPDLKSMSDPQFEEFVTQSDMADFQKTELRIAPDRNKYHQEITFWREYNSARNAYSDYAKFIMFNSIFFSPSLKDLFKKADEECWAAMSSRKIAKEAGSFPGQYMQFYEQWVKAMESLKNLMNQIETLVQERLNRI
ncbi:hypothetical protein [Geothrix sp.]|jgi:hypothetical protein|uniref:hypothetical protein n=1 Tax=Geothrix sp. TaxID=1962974 RepID=UPI0025BF2589|nr:hypothetical protein [Geothrix sp.]